MCVYIDVDNENLEWIRADGGTVSVEGCARSFKFAIIIVLLPPHIRKVRKLSARCVSVHNEYESYFVVASVTAACVRLMRECDVKFALTNRAHRPPSTHYHPAASVRAVRAAAGRGNHTRVYA